MCISNRAAASAEWGANAANAASTPVVRLVSRCRRRPPDVPAFSSIARKSGFGRHKLALFMDMSPKRSEAADLED